MTGTEVTRTPRSTGSPLPGLSTMESMRRTKGRMEEREKAPLSSTLCPRSSYSPGKAELRAARRVGLGGGALGALRTFSCFELPMGSLLLTRGVHRISPHLTRKQSPTDKAALVAVGKIHEIKSKPPLFDSFGRSGNSFSGQRVVGGCTFKAGCVLTSAAPSQAARLQNPRAQVVGCEAPQGTEGLKNKQGAQERFHQSALWGPSGFARGQLGGGAREGGQGCGLALAAPLGLHLGPSDPRRCSVPSCTHSATILAGCRRQGHS